MTPAVLTPDRDAAPADPLRPHWLPQLATALGADTVGRLLADPRWPAVVTAVHRAVQHGIPLTEVLQPPAGADGGPVPDHALAEALTYRALRVTDADPGDRDQEPEHPDHTPPQDLHLLTTALDPNTPLNLADTDHPDDHGAGGPDGHRGPQDRLQDSVAACELALSEAELDEELFHAAAARQWRLPWEPTDEQQERTLARAADAELSPVSLQRLAELNEQAARFYQGTYPGSWARTYLADRLGTDLTGDPRTRPGYAPAGWTALTSHLRRRGATDAELLAAGLAKRASTGRLIDTFRDRVVLPIHHGGLVVGFVGRRSPDTDHTGQGSNPGPKYLNTSQTVLYAKGDQLYGMDQYADRLAGGAVPVLVQGPIDALAVNLSSPGHVGLAPLGTALTDTQADTLIPYLDTTAGAPGVIVDTDPDLAGQLAAERDYWMLTARGGDPLHATLPAGQDPADVLRTSGPGALRDRLHQARALADTIVDERLANLPPAAALREALTVVAAGQARHWVDRAADVAARLHAPTDVALTQLLGQITTWDRHRHKESTRLVHAGHQTRERIHALPTQQPTQRWAPLARQVDPALLRAQDWGALADAIDRTHRAGDDVLTLVPAIAAKLPLSAQQPVTDLRYRLAARLDVPEEPTPRALSWTATAQAARRPTGPGPSPSQPAQAAHRPGHRR